MSPQGPETLALLAGRRTDAPTDTVSVPIYQTASYQFAHVANLFALKEPDNIYARIMNPTNDVLAKRVAGLAGGVAALLLASGQGAPPRPPKRCLGSPPQTPAATRRWRRARDVAQQVRMLAWIF
jgi:cystathionine beta-lyase/cystathionine gamma-synthase